MLNEANAYQKMYYHLFNACEDVVNMLTHAALTLDLDPRKECLRIQDYLVQKLNGCEDIYIEAENQEIDYLEAIDVGPMELFDREARLQYPELTWNELQDEYLDHSDFIENS